MREATLIVQSAPPAPPAWLERCMASVVAWSDARGHAYTRLGEELFAIVPDDIRTRVGAASRISVSDLARLLWLAKALDGGYARAAWIDADVLVFDPAGFALPSAPFACARELWIWRDRGALHFRANASNAVLSFATRAGLLDWYLAAAHRILRESPMPIKRLALGPQILADVDRLAPLPAIDGIATLSPLLVEEAAAGGGDGLALHRAHWRGRVAGAHLCRSLGHTGDAPALIALDLFEPAIDRLLADGSRLLND